LAALFARMVPQAQKGVAEFQTATDVIWRRPGYVLIALFVHVLAWTFGILEVLLTFYFLGRPVSLEHAVIFESLGTTISIAAFFVPGSWGVQEAGYVLIGQTLGLPRSASAREIRHREHQSELRPSVCRARGDLDRLPLELPCERAWSSSLRQHRT
jgi:Lysylphosphatidylglycerol synthase TM region